MQIYKEQQLIKLPRTPNNQDICTKYCKYRSQNYAMIFESTTEIMKGLCFYFDKALPVMLLYKSERQQYADAIADDVSPSMVYGAEHLLRLFGNRCSIQFYATLVLIGGFMVFRPVLETFFLYTSLEKRSAVVMTFIGNADYEIHLLSISTYGATILFAAFSVKLPELLAHAKTKRRH